jgi:integrase
VETRGGAIVDGENDNDLFFPYDGTQPDSEHGQELGLSFFRTTRSSKTADQGGHPYRFRDSFAISLLLKSVSIEIVTTLGHNSIKVMERHYSPWVKAR